MKKVTQRLALCSAIAVAGLAGNTASAHGWNYYIAGYAAATQASFDYSALNDYSGSIDTDEDFDASGLTHTTQVADQTSLGGGYTFGIELQFQHNQFLGLNVSEQFNSDQAKAASSWNLAVGDWSEDDQSAIPLNVENSFRLKHQLQLTLAYGIQLPNKTDWLYVKAGPSVAQLKESSVSSIDIDAFSDSTEERLVSDNINTSASTHSVWGPSIGIGYRHHLSDHVVLFAEYDYAYYGQQNISTLSQNQTVTTNKGNDLTATGDITRKVKVISSSIKAGLGIVW